MKIKILSIAIALALIAVLGAPMAAFAATTDINGILANMATLTAPSNASFTSFVVGINPGSATSGSVVANASGWSLSVIDGKTNNSGFMTIAGTDSPSAIALTNAIQVGITSGNLDTVTAYQDALHGVGGYGQVGSFSIPLFFGQTIVSGDTPGAYKITLIYTATPGT